MAVATGGVGEMLVLLMPVLVQEASQPEERETSGEIRQKWG